MPVGESKTGMGGAWEVPQTFVQMWQKEVLDRSAVLQGCLSARLMGGGEGSLSLSHPSEENGFSQNWAYFISLLGVCGKCGLCPKEMVNSECALQAFHHLSSPQETWEAYLWLPQLAHRKTWNNEKVGSYRKIAISLSYISKAFKNIRVQKGQDGIEASLITSLKIQWEKKVEGRNQLITSHQTSHRKCIPWRNK